MKYFISVKAGVNSQSIEYCIAKLNKLIIQRIVLAQSILPVNVDMNKYNKTCGQAASKPVLLFAFPIICFDNLTTNSKTILHLYTFSFHIFCSFLIFHKFS